MAIIDIDWPAAIPLLRSLNQRTFVDADSPSDNG
jgi:hypothetical protein